MKVRYIFDFNILISELNIFFNKGIERGTFLDLRKRAELMREVSEGYKRRMIHQGKWTEANAD